MSDILLLKKEIFDFFKDEDEISLSVLTEDGYNEKLLFPEELSLISEKAVLKRRIEFCLGRTAAHEALKKIGIENYPVTRGKNNQPIWPDKIVGSISHTSGIALAAVSSKEFVTGIGIDIEETNSKASFEISRQICLSEELKWVSEREEEKMERLISIFSAKESVFKCLHPEVLAYFGFHDAHLTFDDSINGFRGRLVKDLCDKYYAGWEFVVNLYKMEKYVITFMKIKD